ncbi:uncharacterized protein LOC143053630 [Mytilus galloprovincialis]|uniref:uncharacterized protein LOC143053630 n=1 Tax=Mytilus galloprovincialis TaxID=29158 RepID=UPI003F7CA419
MELILIGIAISLADAFLLDSIKGTDINTCKDDPRVVCIASVCNGVLQSYCPLTCKLCSPITAAQHCSDNKLVHCHQDGVCADKILQVQCPVTCGLCQATTSTSIPTTSVPTTSTESIPMTPSPVVQPCLDDPRVTCDTSICDGAFKQFCPATCNTCSPITSIAPCFDDPSINCQKSACSHLVLKDYCKATCGLCSGLTTKIIQLFHPVTTEATTKETNTATSRQSTSLSTSCKDDTRFTCNRYSCSGVLSTFCPFTCNACANGISTVGVLTKSISTASEHSCNKFGLLMDLAFGSNIFNQNARKCEGKSADAVLKKHCSTPNSTKWTKGVQVLSICNSITPYSPVAVWKDNNLTDAAGVVVSCQNGRIEMIAQSCGNPISLRNITRPESDSLFTVLW